MENRCNFLVIPLKSIHFSNLSRKFRTTLILIFFIVTQILGISFNIKAQQAAVKGTVKDQKGETLIGVTVQVKGTTTGVVTDSGGNFNLTNVPSRATLVFSFVGLTTQEIPLNGRSNIDVIMVEEAIGIDEVVVVGYGTSKKVNLTGSIASVTSKELKTISTSNIVTGLAGVLPGLRVTQKTGEPGAYSTQYDIRGFGTPLVVIDGLVMNQSDFVRLNPTEIEQITILKDASAAVYGVKAANGVILVTTKKGDQGKPKITYSGYYELQTLNNRLPIGNAYTFATLTTEDEIFKGVSPTATKFTKEDIQKYKDGTNPSLDWLSLISRDYTTQKNNNISISGGNNKIKYFSSFGFLDEMGLWKSGDLNYKKYNVRSSVTGKISDNLEAELNLYGLMDQKNNVAMSAGDILFITMLQLPTDLVYANNNPQYLQNVTNDSNHPLGLTTKSISGFNNYSNKTFQGSFTLNYKIPFVKGLTAKFMFGFYDNEYFSKSWAQKWMMYSYDKLKDVYANTATKNNPSTLGEGYTTYKRTTTLGQLNYEKSFFEKHNVKASLVYEKRYDTSDDMYASKQFAIDIPQFNSGLVTNMSVSGSNDNENSNLNYIARLNYDFSTKYLLELGFNYSGSSKFPVEKRWGFFPYTSAGWRISEENFFKSALPFVTNLKLRASIGKMGDDAASSFQFLTGYNYPGGNYVFNNTVVPGLGFRGMPNPNITWFTVTSKNAGFDLNLKNGLFTAQFDLFRRDRSGLLGTRLATIPGTVGAALPQENLNSDMRKGYELVLGHSKTIGDFRYEISANVTYTRGQATYLERAPDANSYLNWRNNKTNRWDNISWGYNYIGQFQSVEEILSSPLQDSKGNASVRPGDLKFEDVNKDGVISDLDMVPIGRGVTPEMSFGVSGRLSYRQFDMNFLFQGAANSNYFYDLLFANVNNQVGQARNTMQSWMDRWHHEDIYNPSSPWVPGKYPAIGSSADSWAGTASQFWYVDSKYLRLKNVEIGYTLKKPLLSKIGVENLRIYLSGFNLLTWTKVDYVDPEQDSGYWNATYPISKIYNIGVTFTF